MSAPPVSDFDTLLQQADELYAAADWKGAGEAYHEALALAPGHVHALHRFAMTVFRLGSIDQALELLDRALAIDPAGTDLLKHKGIFLLSAGRIEDGVETLQGALEQNPADVESAFNLGAALRRLGRVEAALPLLEQAAGVLPRVAPVTVELGLALAALGRRDEAMQRYRQALTINPRDVSTRNNLGVLLQQSGNLADAIGQYRQVVALQPDFVFGLNNLAGALQTLGEAEEAVDLCRRAVAIDPGFANAWNNLGIGLQALRKFDEAIDAYARAIAISPLAAEAHANLAECLASAGRENDMLNSYRDVVAKFPGDARAYVLLGAAHDRREEIAQSAEALHTAVTLDADNAEAHFRLGRALARLSKDEVAVGHFQRAIELRPGHGASAVALAKSLLTLGRPGEALDACEQAIAIDRVDQEALAFRAICQRLVGENAAADRFTDPEKVVHVMKLADAPGFDDWQSFNRALVAELRDVANRKWDPAYQSIRGGTQTQDELLNVNLPAIKALRQALDASIAAYIDGLAPDPDHPFFGTVPSRYAYRSWSVILHDQGFHISHIHPEGWLSGVYYVEVPELEDAGGGHPGCLELGRPPMDLPFPEPPPIRYVPPVPGQLVLFPSYLWHGTRPFRSEGQRMTVAFDILPIERR